VVDRLAELDLPVVPYNGGEAPIDKERFVIAEPRITGRCASGSSRARSTSILMTTSSRWQGKCCTDERGKPCRRVHHGGFDDEGLVRSLDCAGLRWQPPGDPLWHGGAVLVGTVSGK
jgi:hypothetical protein